MVGGRTDVPNERKVWGESFLDKRLGPYTASRRDWGIKGGMPDFEGMWWKWESEIKIKEVRKASFGVVTGVKTGWWGRVEREKEWIVWCLRERFRLMFIRKNVERDCWHMISVYKPWKQRTEDRENHCYELKSCIETCGDEAINMNAMVGDREVAGVTSITMFMV